MSRLMGFVLAACLLATATSTSVLATDPDWPKSLTLGTASPGGVYYVYGEAVAQLLTEKLGIPVNPFPTQGPVHNVKLMESGGTHLGLITMGVGLQGWNGTGDWTNGKRFRNMRALFPMYDTSFQFAALRRSGISTVAMLDKLDIGAGPRAGTGGTYVPEILRVLGLSVRVGYGSFNEMATKLLSGEYNALVLTGGAPFPAAKELEAKEPLTFLGPSAEETASIRKAMPELTPSIIPAGTYSSLDKDYSTIGVYNFAVGRSDLPEDLAYQLVKAVFENQPRLIKASSTAGETVPRNVVKNTFLPFHPGAVRYYREIGISIPDSLVPTN
jgi:TRAP transporter TAXI family solute receptor